MAPAPEQEVLHPLQQACGHNSEPQQEPSRIARVSWRSRQFDCVKTLTSTFVGVSRQLSRSEALEAVRAVLRHRSSVRR